MAVVIEELQAEVTPTAPAPAAPRAERSEREPDERKVIETIALETWALRRLIAD